MAKSKTAIYTALGANLAIAATKFVAGAFTGSSAMLSEAVHSLVDTANELLILYGIHSSNKERDDRHPFGYGRELYFWSFIVSILIFGFGAGVAFLQGYWHLRSPALEGPMTWNYVVLGCSLLFEGTSFVVALRAFRKTTQDPLWAAIKRSKDPADFVVLFEDGAAVLGLVVVGVLLFIGQRTGNRYMDGIASLAVGSILTVASALLARESRSLLIGEGISQRTMDAILAMVRADPLCVKVKRHFSLYQSPEEVLLVLIIQVRPELKVDELEKSIAALKQKIRGSYPRLRYILIEAE